jgi:hypothetical protein
MKIFQILLILITCSYSLTLVAVGDIALGVIGTPMKLDSIFSPVKPYLKGDIVFGNLEGVFQDKMTRSSKRGKNYFAFRMQESGAQLLKDGGFTVLNCNNNHSLDYGETGLARTRKVLEALGIKYLRDSLIIGDSIAFLSFYLHTGNICKPWTDSIQQLTERFSQKYKILVVSIHGGQEGSALVRDTCERFLGEYRGNMFEFSHKFIDAGADIVLCHGPHVLRDIEVYKNKLIAHSLGNFCTPFGFNLKDKYGETIILRAEFDKDGNLLNYEKNTEFRQVRNLGYKKEK